MLIVLISGLALGSLYAMTALVYNVMYSTSKVLSVGTGQFAMIGGVFGTWFLTDLGLPFAAAFVLVAAAGVVFGLLTEFVAIRRTMRAGDDHLWVLSTLALATIVQQAVGLWWGTEPRPFPRLIPQDYAGLTDQRYWIPIAAAVAMTIGLDLFYRRTMLGKIFVALSEDAFAVRARGIGPNRVRAASYALAGGLGAVSGFAAGQLTYAWFALGLGLTLNGFIALALGGIGSNLGALSGGLILGLTTTITAHVFGSEFQQTIAIGTLILFLVVRPAGLFGKSSVRQV